MDFLDSFLMLPFSAKNKKSVKLCNTANIILDVNFKPADPGYFIRI